MPGFTSVKDPGPSNPESVNSTSSKGTPLNSQPNIENVPAPSTIHFQSPGTAPSLTVYARSINLQTADIRELLVTANETAAKNRNEINKCVKELKTQQEKSISACEEWGKVVEDGKEKITSATTSLTESSKTLGAAIDTLYAKITSISHLGDVPALLSKQDNILSKVLAKQEEQDSKLSTICAALEKIEPGVTNCLTQLTQQQDGWRFGRDCGDGIDSAQRNNLSDSWLDGRWETQESRGDIASQTGGGSRTLDFYGNAHKYPSEREPHYHHGRYNAGISQKSGESSLLDSQDHHFAIPASRGPFLNGAQKTFTPGIDNAGIVAERPAISLNPYHTRVYSFTLRRPTQDDIEPLTPMQPLPVRQTVSDIQYLGIRQDEKPNILPSKVGQLRRQGARAKLGNTASYVQISTISADKNNNIIDEEETASEAESNSAGLHDSNANINLSSINKRRRLLETQNATRGTDASFGSFPETEGEFLTPQRQGFGMDDFSRNNDINASLLATTMQNGIQQSQQLQFDGLVDNTQDFDAKVQRTLERIDRNEALKTDLVPQALEQPQKQRQDETDLGDSIIVRPPVEPSSTAFNPKKPSLPKTQQLKNNSTHPSAMNKFVNSETYVSKIMQQGETTPASTRNASAITTIKAKSPASTTTTRTHHTESSIKPQKSTVTTTSLRMQSKHAKSTTKKKALNFVYVPKRPRVKVSAPIVAPAPAPTAASAVASITCPAPQAKPTLKGGKPAAASFAGSQAFETCIGGRMGSKEGDITTLAMHAGGGGVSLAGNESAAEGINRTVEHGISGSRGNISSTLNEQYSDDLLNDFSCRRVLRKRKAVQYVF